MTRLALFTESRLMAKIIIEYPDDMPAHRALNYAEIATRKGKVSEAGGVPHFCWATAFPDETTVWTDRKRRGQKSDKLVVERTTR